MPVVHHILLAAATVALGAAGLRVASLAAPRGLERVLSAAALAVATAVVEVLALGSVGLGASSLAIAAAAGLTLAGGPAGARAGAAGAIELARWWGALPLSGRLATGAVAGAWLACQVWLLRYPTLGLDSILYHVSEAIIWVGNGHPGGTDLVSRALPVTNYPVTAEVFLILGARPLAQLRARRRCWCRRRWRSPAWRPGRAYVPARCHATSPCAGHRSGLRHAGGDRLAEQRSPYRPGRVGLAGRPAAALCAASRSRPVLLAPALVAAGLALGTKTTTGPLLVILLVMRPAGSIGAGCGALWKPLAAAALLAFLLRGGVVRPQPDRARLAAVALLGHSLGHFGTARDRVGRLQLHARAPSTRFGSRATSTSSASWGASSCWRGALAAPVLAPRRRAVWVASGAAVLSVLIWAQAPFSGVPPSLRIPETVFTTTRYLAPAVMAAILALALAGSGGGRRARVAQLILAVGLVIELVQSFQLGFPAMPSPLTPLAGAVAGAAAIGAGAVISRRVDTPAWRAAPAALVAAVLVAGALLAIPASGYVARHAAAGSSAAGLVDWMARRPADSAGVVGAPGVIGPLAGDRLRRRLEAIPPGTGCRTLRALRRTRYVVLSPGGGADADVRSLVRCLSRPDYRDAVFEAWAPG